MALTDLDSFKLYKITSSILNPDASNFVESTAWLRWCTPDDEHCGIRVLWHLSSMPHQQLGMRSYMPGLKEFRITHFLGKGHLAGVYSVQQDAAEDPTVLKIELAKNEQGRAASPANNSAFDHERSVLLALRESGSQESPAVSERDARATARGRAALDDTLAAAPLPVPTTQPAQAGFNILDHIPQIVSVDQGLPVLHIRPVGTRLTWFNIRAAHLDQLMATFQSLHTVSKRFHRDVSYRNLLVAPVGWRARAAEAAKASQCDASTHTSILLVDWEFSVEMGNPDANQALTGTAITMSQRQLAAGFSDTATSAVITEVGCAPSGEHAEEDTASAAVDQTGVTALAEGSVSVSADEAESATSDADFVYEVRDELEAAVKSVLLILSPALKRRIKEKATTAPWNNFGSQQRHAHLHAIWGRVLPPHVYTMCSNADYQQLATWLKTALLHFDPAEE